MTVGEGNASETVYGYFEQTVRTHHGKLALSYLGAEWTYGEFNELIVNFASSLYDMGARKGDRALIYLSNTPQWLISWLGMMRLGVIPVPVSPIYTPVDLKYMANDSEAETIVCMDTNFGYVEEIYDETNLKRIIVTTLVDMLPLWKRLMGMTFNVVPKGKRVSGKDIHPFKKMLRASSVPPSYDDLGIEGGDLVEMLYTGGTTGFPKGVPFSNLNLLSACLTQRSMSEPVVPKGEDTVVQGAPLFHVLGQGMAMGDLLSGDTCIILPGVQLDGLLNHIEKYRATTFFGVPALYRMVLEHRRSEYYDIGSLKYCFCAGDVLPAEIERRWKERYQVDISQGYGATETCGGVALTPANETPPEGSGGKLLPGKRVKVVEPDTVQPVKKGEAGELLVSSDHMVMAYWNKKEETERCFVEIDGDMWYRTKDIVRIDENGWLYFMDRSVDTIKHKGYRIAASEIEAALQENPAVIASCVVGIPDEKVGERIKAFVVLKEDVKGVTGYDLIKWCRTRLAPYKVPYYIEFRDMLPKSKVGKLLRREVRGEEQRKIEN
ncbi:MAG: class I adenylate-forming enzyme family protein [Desulfatiglans sp.]|jgi:long-chain acyl-CoA synthetase|nr:class I adenylate-forming enzyme family protein [Desulfatiglans sp.]